MDEDIFNFDLPEYVELDVEETPEDWDIDEFL